MAIYHMNIKIISRSKGSSAIASSAYRSGTKLIDEEVDKICDYSRKTGIVFNEVLLCENAPKEYQDRQILWNRVHQIESAKTSQLAREVEVALPREFDTQKQIQVVREYIKENFTSVGMCADWSLHDKNDRNPHAHIMLTTRPILADGKWGLKEKKGYALDEHGERIPLIDKTTGKQKVDKKNCKQWKRAYLQTNDWNNHENAEKWRKSWADICNKYLDKDNQIDHRSYKRRGIELKPTIHEGYVARKMERNGKISDRCQINREINLKNNELLATSQELEQINKSLKELELLSKLVDTRNKYYQEYVKLSILQSISKPKITIKCLEKVAKDFKIKFKELLSIKEELNQCKFYQLIKKSELTSQYDITFHEYQKIFNHLMNIQNSMEFKKSEFNIHADGLNSIKVDNFLNSITDALITRTNIYNKALKLLEGVTSQSVKSSLLDFQECFNQVAYEISPEIINKTLQDEPTTLNDLEKEFPISKSVYLNIQKNINNILNTENSKQEPLFCLEDLNNPKYAPKSFKKNAPEKNKGLSR